MDGRSGGTRHAPSDRLVGSWPRRQPRVVAARVGFANSSSGRGRRRARDTAVWFARVLQGVTGRRRSSAALSNRSLPPRPVAAIRLPVLRRRVCAERNVLQSEADARRARGPTHSDGTLFTRRLSVLPGPGPGGRYELRLAPARSRRRRSSRKPKRPGCRVCSRCAACGPNAPAAHRWT
jgi:hypothetical protein